MAKDPRLDRVGVSGYNDYKVYVHQKADTGEIFYVGKGRRWRENQRKGRNKHWHSVVAKHGFTVSVVAENLTNAEACLFEKTLISKLGFETLVNYTYGGEGSEGYRHSVESLLKMRGRQLSSEHKKKLSDSKLVKPTNFWCGKKRDSETSIKISDSLSNPARKEAEFLLLSGASRKEVAEKLNLSMSYLRGLVSRLRKKGHEIEILVN